MYNVLNMGNVTSFDKSNHFYVVRFTVENHIPVTFCQHLKYQITMAAI